ncbi:hypothetical protein [Roseicyclus mahoneyensis]|uniref:Putative 4-hydroxy-4-methyl-2-oxoglutarate aldolase n=1 Tax=Roseicyclus mahoneyensis TaxID=164332 RepID=A0A316GDX8_9RHOB|nr:hypothetical protein [Roseicyclus mahoneyensis]PWK58136.1 demethylmenaquinone methyltransferase [Roseicyclus mahoneyensis]
MTPTCALYDHVLDQTGVLPPALQHFAGRGAFSGHAATVKTHEMNTRVRKLAHSPGKGRVMVADGGGSLRRALMGLVLEIEGVRVAPGDMIVADAGGGLVIPQGLPLPG